jgi:magnesium-protoporphyrin IX monomethyl ester (oxidative) cyclase
MLLRADPKLLTGANKLWVKFFILSVYATMYVRDHSRPEFHKALGIDPTAYDYKVFDICNQISRQVFPVEVDIDTPAFRARMEGLLRASRRIDDGKERGGITGWAMRVSGMASAALNFAGLYLLPAKSNALPSAIRLQPAW